MWRQAVVLQIQLGMARNRKGLGKVTTTNWGHIYETLG